MIWFNLKPLLNLALKHNLSSLVHHSSSLLPSTFHFSIFSFSFYLIFIILLSACICAFISFCSLRLYFACVMNWCTLCTYMCVVVFVCTVHAILGFWKSMNSLSWPFVLSKFIRSGFLKHELAKSACRA